MSVRTASPSTERPTSEFAEVGQMLRELKESDSNSAAYRRLRDRIVQRCLPVADNIAYRYRGRGESLDDLQQVARLGLINAVTRFDVAVGAEFLSYAVPTIMGEIRRHFRDHGWSVRVPRRLKELQTQINAATSDLSQRLHRAPTATELAEELGIDRQEIVEALIAGGGYATRSTDGPSYADDEPGAATIVSTLGTLDHQLAHVDDRESLRPLIMALPDRERTILALRFFEGLTQSQIAARIGVSQMQVSRLLGQTLTHFRVQLLYH